MAQINFKNQSHTKIIKNLRRKLRKHEKHNKSTYSSMIALAKSIHKGYKKGQPSVITKMLDYIFIIDFFFLFEV